MRASSATRSNLAPEELSPAVPSGQSQLLVLGYGNVLLGDDGLGPYIAEQVAGWKIPGVRALAVPLLTPELAAELTAAELAVFVDASLAITGHPQLIPLIPAPTSAGLGHALTPAGLLALAQAVFGQCPPAWILGVPAADFSLGENFSGTARDGAIRALCQLRHLSQGLAGRPGPART
jgi:hydrogenase maturation protease